MLPERFLANIGSDAIAEDRQQRGRLRYAQHLSATSDWNGTSPLR